MSIRIDLVGDQYLATVTPPHGSAAWATPNPLPRAELIAKLREIGCHTTDIGDAFYAADPDWLTRDN